MLANGEFYTDTVAERTIFATFVILECKYHSYLVPKDVNDRTLNSTITRTRVHTVCGTHSETLDL
jgi:hypothetical protein